MIAFRYGLLLAALCCIYLSEPVESGKPLCPITTNCKCGVYWYKGCYRCYRTLGQSCGFWPFWSRCAKELVCKNHRCVCQEKHCQFGSYFGGKFHCRQCCPPFPQYCHWGWTKDKNGCWKCKCPPKPWWCPFGKYIDSNGCTRCKCAHSPLWCPYGWYMNFFGCWKCVCHNQPTHCINGWFKDHFGCWRCRH